MIDLYSFNNYSKEAIKRAYAIAYSYKETIHNTVELCHLVINKVIPGHFVECGVGAGAQLLAMQVANLFFPQNLYRNIYAFDSFEGIPLAGEHDQDQPGIGEIKHDTSLPIEQRLVSSGVTVHSLDNVQRNVMMPGLPLNNIHFIKGWFQNTVAKCFHPTEKIAILRLDGDLYESTIVCLEALYPLVSIGGYVIIDDYALEGCKKAVHDYLIKNGIVDKPIELSEMMIPVEGSGGVVYFKKVK